MIQGSSVTLIGYVAREPAMRSTKDGRKVADLRVGITPRVVDRATGEWRDGASTYITVNCWRSLASNVAMSLRKGERIFVRGRLRSREFTDNGGVERTVIEVVADTVGHDLSWLPVRCFKAEVPYRKAQRPGDGSPGNGPAAGDAVAGDAVAGDAGMESAGMESAGTGDAGTDDESMSDAAVDGLAPDEAAADGMAPDAAAAGGPPGPGTEPDPGLPADAG